MTTFDSSLFATFEDGSDYNKTNEKSITNPFVNWFNHEGTQTLQDMMVAEAIQMRGVECYYLPSTYVNKDELFGEDISRRFDNAWKFAAYLDSFEGYEGTGSFFSKYGYQVNDEVTLSVNPKMFAHQVGGHEPKEGDLIYFKMDNSLFEIIWVEPYNPFFQAGQNVIRKITAQKFIYSGEEINPKLQTNDDICVPEFSELDLSPVRALNGRADTRTHQYEEVDEINAEAEVVVEPYVVFNNKGIDGYASPFDDDFSE